MHALNLLSSVWSRLEPCASVYNPPMNKRPRPEDLKTILLLFLWLHANQAGSNMSGKKRFDKEDT